MSTIVRWILIGFVVLVGIGFVRVAYRVATMPPAKAVAGEPEFEAANSHLTSMASKQNLADGNSTAAQKVAASTGKVLQQIIEQAFTGGKPGLGEMYQKRNVAVYCELREDQCAFLMSVPELRHYKSDALKALKQFAWLSAQKAIESSELKNKDIKIAVGLKGAIFYGPILIGKSSGEPTTEVEGISGMKSLYPFFVFTPEPPAPAKTNATPAVAKPEAAKPTPAEAKKK